MNLNWGICGHKNITDFLQAAIVNNNIAHAYLFVGPKNLGKNTLAKNFVCTLLCQENDSTKPCGRCFHCKQLKNGIHPDVYVVEQQVDDKTDKLKRNISIEQIRELKNKLGQGTFLNSYKSAIIPDAQLMNNNSANALLKVLEEPTPKTVLILIADDIDSVPQTIASRCQVLKFLPVASSEIEKCLQEKGADDGRAKLLARLAQGRPGMAIALSQDGELFQRYTSSIDNFIKILKSDISQRLKILDELIEWQKDETININSTEQLFINWQALIRDFLLTANDNEPLICNLNFLSQISQEGKNISFDRIQHTMRLIKDAKIYLSKNISSKTVLENLLINI